MAEFPYPSYFGLPTSTVKPSTLSSPISFAQQSTLVTCATPASTMLPLSPVVHSIFVVTTTQIHASPLSPLNWSYGILFILIISHLPTTLTPSLPLNMPPPINLHTTYVFSGHRFPNSTSELGYPVFILLVGQALNFLLFYNHATIPYSFSAWSFLGSP